MSVYGLSDGLDKLIPLVQRKKLIIFVGSGISVPSGLPTWDSLLDKFIDFCDRIRDTLNPPGLTADIIADARREKSQYPIRVASVLKEKLNALENTGIANFDRMFRKWFLRTFTAGSFNDNHRIIVQTDYPFILTSNYDNLIEDAAEATGNIGLVANSFTFKDAEKVGGAIYEGVPSIIHVHGDINDVVHP